MHFSGPRKIVEILMEKQNKKKQKMRTLGKVVSKLESKISKRYYQMFEQTKGSFYYVFTMRIIRSNFVLN